MKVKALPKHVVGGIAKVYTKATLMFHTMDGFNVSAGEVVWISNYVLPLSPIRAKITELVEGEDVWIKTDKGEFLWSEIFAYKNGAIEKHSVKLADGVRAIEGQHVWMWRTYGLAGGGSIVRKTLADIYSNRNEKKVACRYENSKYIREENPAKLFSSEKAALKAMKGQFTNVGIVNRRAA